MFFSIRRRASEVRVSYGDVVADDTFEHILNVTSNNDALLAYYYLDGDNKVRMKKEIKKGRERKTVPELILYFLELDKRS